MTSVDISLLHFVFWAVFAGSFTALVAYDLLLWLVDMFPDFLQLVALFVVSVWRRRKS